MQKNLWKSINECDDSCILMKIALCQLKNARFRSGSRGVGLKRCFVRWGKVNNLCCAVCIERSIFSSMPYM